MAAMGANSSPISETDSLKSDDALSRQKQTEAAMQEMTWLTQAEKKYLWSTIYKSEYQGG